MLMRKYQFNHFTLDILFTVYVLQIYVAVNVVVIFSVYLLCNKDFENIINKVLIFLLLSQTSNDSVSLLWTG